MINTLPYFNLTLYLMATVFSLRYSIIFFRSTSYDLRPLIVYTIMATTFFTAFLYGFRDVGPLHGGVDTVAYQNIFNSLDVKNPDTFFNQRVEKGYILIMWISKSLGFDFHGFMLFFYLLLSYFFYKISMHLTRHWTILFSILLISLIMLDSFNISRMSLGTLVLFYAFIKMSLGHKVKSLMLLIFSVSLQVTFLWGLFVFIYYFMIIRIHRRFRWLFNIFIFSCSFFLVEVFKDILMAIGYIYHLQNDDSSPSYLNYFFIIIVLFFYYLFLNGKLDNKISKNIIMVLPSMLFIIPFYAVIPIAYRFNYIYFPMIAFIIPDIYIASKKSKNGRVVGLCVAIIPILYAILKFYSYFSGDIVYLLDWSFQFN